MASPVSNCKRSFDDSSASPGPKAHGSAKSKTPDAHEPEDNGKKKRRKVNHACVYCRRSHMTCDLQRPCARCVKRDIGHLCHDEPRDGPKRGKSEVGVADLAPAIESEVKAVVPGAIGDAQYGRNGNGDIQFGPMDAGQQIAQPQPISPNQLQRPQSMDINSNSSMLNFDWNNIGVRSQFQDIHHLHPNYMFNTSEVTNEYNLLNDFLSASLLDDGAMYSNNDDAQALYTDPLLATSSVNLPLGNLNQCSNSLPIPSITSAPSQVTAGNDISRPTSTYPVDTHARDKFYMTAADPAGLSSAEDRLHKLLKAKYDAGMLKPFNYVKGYAKLNSYMEKNMSRESRVRILRQLDRFRPKFREAMHSLTDMQLVLVEMWFERSLMEYDRVFASMAIPACCWRRTGEIFRGNREMADLLNIPIDRLRDGKLAIHEIIAEESLVSYWEKFGAIAFDASQKAILTSCVLKSLGPAGKGKRCCFSFTIRRDSHSIPSLVVGNWIPIQPK